MLAIVDWVKDNNDNNKSLPQETTQSQVDTIIEPNEPDELPNEDVTTTETTTTMTTTTTTTTTTVQTEPPEPQPEPLMEPYGGSAYEKRDIVKIGGMPYYDCYLINGGGSWSIPDVYMLYNLEGRFSRLEFDIGHVDETANYNSVYKISVDKKVVQTVEINADDLLVHVTIDLNNGNQLKIESIDGDFRTKYGIVNATLYP